MGRVETPARSAAVSIIDHQHGNDAAATLRLIARAREARLRALAVHGEMRGIGTVSDSGTAEGGCEADSALDAIAGLDLEDYHLYHATRADLLTRRGRCDEAALAYDRAIRLTSNAAERELLDRRSSGTPLERSVGNVVRCNLGESGAASIRNVPDTSLGPLKARPPNGLCDREARSSKASNTATRATGSRVRERDALASLLAPEVYARSARAW